MEKDSNTQNMRLSFCFFIYNACRLIMKTIPRRQHTIHRNQERKTKETTEIEKWRTNVGTMGNVCSLWAWCFVPCLGSRWTGQIFSRETPATRTEICSHIFQADWKSMYVVEKPARAPRTSKGMRNETWLQLCVYFPIYSQTNKQSLTNAGCLGMTPIQPSADHEAMQTQPWAPRIPG